MATKYMCVSEDEIAFWGCLFPKTDRMPRNMVKMEYAGKPLRIDVFDYDLSIRYRCCSIEQVFTEDEMHNVPEWEGLIPKRVMKEEKNMESQDQINKGMRAKNHCVRGYKMAWYGFISSCILPSCSRGVSFSPLGRSISRSTRVGCRICSASTA